MHIEIVKVGYLETNCYLIIKNNKCIIVDPGDEFEKIKKKIEELGLVVKAIFITHHHFDHIGVLDECINKYNVKVYDYNNYTSDDKLFTVDDFKFYMIKTIGHKEDLITYYFKDENIMFVGDFIFKNDIGRCDLDGGNFKYMLKSIKKIKTYPLNTKIYPGHGADTTLENEIINNKYFKNA